jgi:hypothetical protein
MSNGLFHFFKDKALAMEDEVGMQNLLDLASLVMIIFTKKNDEINLYHFLPPSFYTGV